MSQNDRQTQRYCTFEHQLVGHKWRTRIGLSYRLSFTMCETCGRTVEDEQKR